MGLTRPRIAGVEPRAPPAGPATSSSVNSRRFGFCPNSSYGFLKICNSRNPPWQVTFRRKLSTEAILEPSYPRDNCLNDDFSQSLTGSTFHGKRKVIHVKTVSRACEICLMIT